MSVAAEDLARLVNTTESDGVLQVCLDESAALVDRYLEGHGDVDEPPPAAILDRAYLLVAAELFNQRQAPNGYLNQQFDAPDGIQSEPIRISRDPLAAARPLLAQWVYPSIA